jgi:uncharacterized membrane protein YdjX (TVP38/TMEM64 family)
MPANEDHSAGNGARKKLAAMVRGLGVAGPGLLVATVGPVFGVVVLASTTEVWLPWFSPGLWSQACFLGLGAILAAFCLVPTHATSVLAGYLFGVSHGIAISYLLVLIAGSIGFTCWGWLAGGQLLNSIASNLKAKRVHAALLGRGYWRSTWLISLLRISPVMPFAATNILLASLAVRFGTFLSATMIGVTPRCVGAAIVGAELSQIDWQAKSSVWYSTVAIVSTIVMLLAVGRIARAALRNEMNTINPSSKSRSS